MSIRDKFRKRYLGQMRYAGGESAETMNQPIVQSTSDNLENQQTQQTAVYDKVYKPGQRPQRERGNR